jgi:hypothetical protein
VARGLVFVCGSRPACCADSAARRRRESARLRARRHPGVQGMFPGVAANAARASSLRTRDLLPRRARRRAGVRNDKYVETEKFHYKFVWMGDSRGAARHFSRGRSGAQEQA